MASTLAIVKDETLTMPSKDPGASGPLTFRPHLSFLLCPHSLFSSHRSQTRSPSVLFTCRSFCIKRPFLNSARFTSFLPSGLHSYFLLKKLTPCLIKTILQPPQHIIFLCLTFLSFPLITLPTIFPPCLPLYGVSGMALPTECVLHGAGKFSCTHSALNSDYHTVQHW